MNTRRLTEGKEKRKPDLDPYRSPNDARLTVSIICFIVHNALLATYHAVVAKGFFRVS